MHTFVMSSQTADASIADILKQAATGGVEVRDVDGKVVAYVLSPTDREAWTYAEANLELDQNGDAVREALGRRGGVTTKELLGNAAAAQRKSGN